MLFVSWSDSCAWPSRTCLVFQITVATAEMHHPSPHCAHIHCLVSRNIQQVLRNVNVCNFFNVEELNDTSLLHLHFHVRQHSVRLSLCCHLAKTCNRILVGRLTSTALPSPPTSDVVGQYNQMEGITFRAVLV